MSQLTLWVIGKIVPCSCINISRNEGKCRNGFLKLVRVVSALSCPQDHVTVNQPFKRDNASWALKPNNRNYLGNISEMIQILQTLQAFLLLPKSNILKSSVVVDVIVASMCVFWRARSFLSSESCLLEVEGGIGLDWKARLVLGWGPNPLHAAARTLSPSEALNQGRRRWTTSLWAIVPPSNLVALLRTTWLLNFQLLPRWGL